MSETGKPNKKLTSAHLNQLNVLKSLIGSERLAEPLRLQIDEIAEKSGLRDEKEAQRYLFILEGQKLVSPFPEGDFTSKTWYITRHGQKALRQFQTSGLN